MKQSSKRMASIGVALVLVIVALVVFFNMIQPEYGNVQSIKAQVMGEAALLDRVSHSVDQVKQLVGNYQSQSAGASSVALAMPTGADLAGAIEQIYGIAQANGIGIQSIGVSAPTLEARTAAGGAGASTAGGSASSSAPLVRPIGTISLQISAVGSYENLKNFLSGLETNVRIFDVKGITLSPQTGLAGSRSAFSGQDSFTYNITVATYYQTQ